MGAAPRDSQTVGEALRPTEESTGTRLTEEELKAQRKGKVESALEQMQREPAVKLDKLGQIGTAGKDIGLLESLKIALQNKGRALMDSYNGYGLSISLPEVVANRMDGSRRDFSGWAMNHLVKPFETATRKSDEFARSLMDKVVAGITEVGLPKVSRERITAYAELQQGMPVERLIKSGFDRSTIEDIVNNGLKPEEMKFYENTRKVLDNDIFPRVAKAAYETYGITLKKVDNYWPRRVDMDRADFGPEEAKSRLDAARDGEMSLTEFMDNLSKAEQWYPQNAKAPSGFTKERVHGAMQPIKTDSGENVSQHIRNVARFAEMSEPLKFTKQLINSKQFGEHYGRLAQDFWNNHMEVEARGGSIGTRTPWLDNINKWISSGVLGGRISQLKHLSNIPFAVRELGINGYREAMFQTLPGTEGNRWVDKVAPDIVKRSGGEEVLMDIMEGKSTMDQARAASFYMERAVDNRVAKAVWYKAYMNKMAEKGIGEQEAMKMPVDEDAYAAAQYTSRRVVTSPMARNVSHLQSRGESGITRGNISLARALNAFQTTMIRHGSMNMKHQVWDMGIGKGDFKYAAPSLLALAASFGIEEAITGLGAASINYATGYKPKQERGEGRKVLDYGVKRLFPMYGTLGLTAINAMKPGQTGSPPYDIATTGGRAIKALALDQNERGNKLSQKEQKRAIIDALGAVGVMRGIPLSSLTSQILSQQEMAKNSRK